MRKIGPLLPFLGLTHAKATRRSQLRHATEPAPPKIEAGSDSNPSRLRRQSEPAPSSIRAGSDSNPSWLRPLPFPRGIKSPSLRPPKRIHLALTLAAFQSSPTVAISSAHHTPNLHKCSACYSSTTSHTQHSTSGEGNFTVEKSGGNLSTPNFIGATPSATRKRCAPCVNGTTRTRTDAASGH